MSARHITERFLPDKAIDLMDEAAAFIKLSALAKEIPEQRHHITAATDAEVGKFTFKKLLNAAEEKQAGSDP